MKAVAFISVGMDWAIAYKPKMERLWRGPAYSPHHPPCKCYTMEKQSGSVSWTEPSVSIPYLEQCSLSASSYLTSSTGSLTKYCDTRIFILACNGSIFPTYTSYSSSLLLFLYLLYLLTKSGCHIHTRSVFPRHFRSKNDAKTMCSGVTSGFQKVHKVPTQSDKRGLPLDANAAVGGLALLSDNFIQVDCTNCQSYFLHFISSI